MQLVRLSIAAAIVALVLAVPAFAGGNSLNGGYPTTPHNVAGAVAKGPSAQAAQAAPTPTPTAKGGTLPFTGADLGIFVAAAAALTVTGLAFRRFGRQSD